MQEIKKLNILSVAKISAIFGLVLGIIAGIYTSLIIPAMLSADPTLAEQANIPGNFYLYTLVLVPIIYIIICFLSGLIGAALYNLFAKWIGGIKIELTEAKSKKK